MDRGDETQHALKSDDWISNPQLIRITVGENAEFKVHSALLAGTTFFEIELPMTPVSQSDASTISSSNTVVERSSSTIASEGQEQIDERIKCASFPHNGQAEDASYNGDKVKDEDDLVFVSSSKRSKLGELHYHFAEKAIYCPTAYGMFLKYLYSSAIQQKPVDTSIGVFFRCWMIADRYKCTRLQNELMSMIREHYIENLVSLENLEWVARRSNSELSCKLLAYLIEQIVFQTLYQSADDQGGNLGGEAFWVLGTCPLRYHVFQALVRQGKHKRTRNPALTTSKKWYVQAA